MSNITFKKGNIFSSDKQTIVNTINCVGVMGKGVALGLDSDTQKCTRNTRNSAKQTDCHRQTMALQATSGRLTMGIEFSDKVPLEISKQDGIPGGRSSEVC